MTYRLMMSESMFVCAQCGSQHIYQPIGKPGELNSMLTTMITLENMTAVKFLFQMGISVLSK